MEITDTKLLAATIRKIEEIYEARNVGCEVHFIKGVMYIIYEESEKPSFNTPLLPNITPWMQFHYEFPSNCKVKGVSIPYACISRRQIGDI